MDCKVTISPSAREDLRSAVEYIAADNPTAAEQLGSQMLDEIELLATMPELGRIVPEFAIPELRELIRPPYRIVYRINKEAALIEVVRIWHAARGIPEV